MKAKLLLNTTFGGFSLSEDVVEKAIEKGMDEDHFQEAHGVFFCDPLEMSQFEFRSDDRLIEAAEEVRSEGGWISGYDPKNVHHSRFESQDCVQIVEVFVDIYLSDYDGKESIKVGSIFRERQ
jgi:hypothetical protein